jgi:hypothetical protein
MKIIQARTLSLTPEERQGLSDVASGPSNLHQLHNGVPQPHLGPKSVTSAWKWREVNLRILTCKLPLTVALNKVDV